MRSDLLIQMNKRIYNNIHILIIFQFMVFKIFQNYLLLYQWHHATFYVKKSLN